MKSPLENWHFLLGKWKGKAEDQFGEKGVIETEFSFTSEPSDKFLMAKGESRNQGRLVNKGVGFLFYDETLKKFKRKWFYSYGFVNNETECYSSDKEIKFDVEVEPLPEQFKGLRWRSFIRKISEKCIAMGLEVAEGKGAFKKYGETIAVKIK